MGEVQGRNVLTNFHGMDLTRDKLCSMGKKWQTLIEAHIDVKTTDGYLLRVFCIGFTKKRNNQCKKTCYAKSTQVKAIRKKMVELISREVSSNDMKEVVKKPKFAVGKLMELHGDGGGSTTKGGFTSEAGE